LDQADFGFSSTISVINGTTLTIGSGADLLSVGDIVYQSSTLFATISSINTVASTVVISADPGFTLAACDMLYAINTDIQWVPITLDNPGSNKQVNTVEMLFKSDFNGSATLAFETDLNPSEATVTLTGNAIGLWGLFAWGESPWGGVPLRRPIRQWVPRTHQICSQLTLSFRHRVGFTTWKLAGISVFGNPGTERIGR
jgi:hypothetical protein